MGILIITVVIGEGGTELSAKNLKLFMWWVYTY